MEEISESEMSTENISNKITDLSMKQSNRNSEYDKTAIDLSNAGDVISNITLKRPDHSKNLPGSLQHVSGETQIESPEKKRLKLSSSPVTNSPDSSSSPEVSKRRRIQHDYRRLSSAGYLDDYETRRERRFSSESDHNQSPSPTKPKSNNTTPTKLHTPEFPSVPRVKLKLKLLRSNSENVHVTGENGKWHFYGIQVFSV